MEPATAIKTAAISGNAAHDMSFISLFLHAGIIVQAIMVCLLLASIWSWTIIFEKRALLKRLNGSAKVFEDAFWSGSPLEKLYERVMARTSDPIIAVFVSGMREWQTATAKGLLPVAAHTQALLNRIQQLMGNTIGKEMEKVERRLTFLASLGSSAPFIGLFGTVWGIMHSFIGLAGAENTSLAAVAPGIAEALLATGMGLIAAIPAVLAYNKFASDFGRYGERLENFSVDFMVVLNRNLHEGLASQQLPQPNAQNNITPNKLSA